MYNLGKIFEAKGALVDQTFKWKEYYYKKRDLVGGSVEVVLGQEVQRTYIEKHFFKLSGQKKHETKKMAFFD